MSMLSLQETAPGVQEPSSKRRMHLVRLDNQPLQSY